MSLFLIMSLYSQLPVIKTITATCIKYLRVCRLVLIADKDKVYEEFPTPLINRLEKHYLVTSIILSENQMKLKEKIEFWVKSFSRVLKSRM